MGMATCSYSLNYLFNTGRPPLILQDGISTVSRGFNRYFDKRNSIRRIQAMASSNPRSLNLSLLEATPFTGNLFDHYSIPKTVLADLHAESLTTTSSFMERLTLADLDPQTAKLVIAFLGPFLSAFAFLFILRIIMSWYPKLPVEKFPYIIAYAPTEPILVPTRKLIKPLGGVDVTPVVWFGLVSFLNEILVGPQGLLVLLSQQVN